MTNEEMAEEYFKSVCKDYNEEKEMLYTLSVNLEYFEKEMERAERFYRNGKRADSYAHIAKMLKFTCSLVKERLDEIKE